MIESYKVEPGNILSREPVCEREDLIAMMALYNGTNGSDFSIVRRNIKLDIYCSKHRDCLVRPEKIIEIIEVKELFDRTASLRVLMHSRED